MQNRYAGDVGDFGKLSLLRSIFSYPEYKLGVVWYQFPDESHNGDGRHVSYLNSNEYQQCDYKLVDGLSKVVNGERSITHLESLNLLPENTIYYSAILNFHCTHSTQKNIDKNFRKNQRIKWLDDAVEETKECNVVFHDPDNGLGVPSIPTIHQVKSGKYAYYSEVNSLIYNKKACVVYHHLNMNEAHKIQIEFRASELKKKISQPVTVFAIRYKPYSPRVSFIISSESEAKTIRIRINNYLNSKCSIGWDTFYEV